MTKFAGKYKASVVLKDVPATLIVGTNIPLLPDKPKMVYQPHGGTAKLVPKYTGTEILGIGTLHKSNAQPIFSKQVAEDIAKMRRN